MIANIHYVNNTPSDISLLFPYFKDAYNNEVLHEDVSDLFNIHFVSGLNEDGSKRMIIEAA
jgi:hypothetical protein